MSNFKNVTVTVSGLEPNHLYYYTFDGLGGNWPATLSGGSGLLAVEAANKPKNINTAVQFCATTGSCYGSSNLLPHTIEPTRQDNSDIFTILNFVLRDSVTDNVVLSQTVNVYCGDCIQYPVITSTYNSILTNTNSTNLVLNISDLVVGETYNYTFYGLDGNWPVMLSNISGTIVPSRRDNNILNSRITFVESSGLHVLDNNRVIEPVSCTADKDLYTVIYASLTAATSPNEAIRTENIFISCNNCLPTPKIVDIGNVVDNTIEDIVLSSSHQYPLSVKLENLHKNTRYNYMFHSVNGNWPVHINNLSGSFTANGPTFDLKTKFTFCESTGICYGSTNSILNSDIACLNTNNKYFTGYLYLAPIDCPQSSSTSNHFTINCSGCVNRLSASMMPSDQTTTQYYDLSTSFDNLVIGKTYNYSFDGIYGNWPVVIDPASGSITAKSSSHIVSNKVVFTFPTGDAIGQPGLLDYTINNITQDYGYKFTKFRSYIVDSECSDINAYSNEMVLTCNGCLPCLNCATISFSGGPTLMLPTGCCSGTDMMFVSVTGANPNNPYRYELSSLSGDITFVPSTGLVYVKNNGSSIIPVLMTTNLILTEQALAQAKLIDIGSGAEVVDYLGFVCGSGCSTEYLD